MSGLLHRVTSQQAKSPHYVTTSSAQYTSDAGVGNHQLLVITALKGTNPCEGPSPAKVPHLVLPLDPPKVREPPRTLLQAALHLGTAALEELNTFTSTSQLPTNCNLGEVLPCPTLCFIPYTKQKTLLFVIQLLLPQYRQLPLEGLRDRREEIIYKLHSNCNSYFV